MRVSWNIFRIVAAFLFAIAWGGYAHLWSVNADAFQAAGLFFLALSALLVLAPRSVVVNNTTSG